MLLDFLGITDGNRPANTQKDCDRTCVIRKENTEWITELTRCNDHHFIFFARYKQKKEIPATNKKATFPKLETNHEAKASEGTESE